MKSLLIYYSKHGCTKKVSEILAKKLNADIFEVEKANQIEFEKYDKIILGTAVYAGNTSRKFTNYLKQNKDKILEKELGLFICGLNTEEFDKEFDNIYPLEFQEKAIAFEKFEGEIIISKLNIFEKLAVKIIMKKKEDILRINEAEIEDFAKKLI